MQEYPISKKNMSNNFRCKAILRCLTQNVSATESSGARELGPPLGIYKLGTGKNQTLFIFLKDGNFRMREGCILEN